MSESRIVADYADFTDFHLPYGQPSLMQTVARMRDIGKMNNNLKHKDITQKIIGAAFEIHKFLGNGFQEVIYQRALVVEIKKQDWSLLVRSSRIFSLRIFRSLSGRAERILWSQERCW